MFRYLLISWMALTKGVHAIKVFCHADLIRDHCLEICQLCSMVFSLAPSTCLFVVFPFSVSVLHLHWRKTGIKYFWSESFCICCGDVLVFVWGMEFCPWAFSSWCPFIFDLRDSGKIFEEFLASFERDFSSYEGLFYFIIDSVLLLEVELTWIDSVCVILTCGCLCIKHFLF